MCISFIESTIQSINSSFFGTDKNNAIGFWAIAGVATAGGIAIATFALNRRQAKHQQIRQLDERRVQLRLIANEAVNEQQCPLITHKAASQTANDSNPAIIQTSRDVNSLPSLEEDPLILDEICYLSVTLNVEAWDGFLSPNEFDPLNIQQHLIMEYPGFIVSTGLQRSFFNLCLSDENCQGLIIRDINPKVKAAADFTVLLLRLSTSREEFVKLAAKPSDGDYKKANLTLVERIRSSDIPSMLKKYYIKNIEVMTNVFYHMDDRFENDYKEYSPSAWRDSSKESFEGVQYYKDDILFEKLRKFAKSGMIIATVGDINNLCFLKGRKIAIVDISNIYQYVPEINIKLGVQPLPKIIYTLLPHGGWQYPCHYRPSMPPSYESIFSQICPIKVSTSAVL